MTQPFSPFDYATKSVFEAVEYWQKRQVRETSPDSAFLHGSVIAKEIFDTSELKQAKVAAWILFRHVDVMKHGVGGVWEVGIFEYQVWRLENPELAPMLVRQEMVTKEHPDDGPASMQDLAQGWDESWLDGSLVRQNLIVAAWDGRVLNKLPEVTSSSAGRSLVPSCA